MAPRIHDHAKREPRTRLSKDRRGYFFPGEVARILQLDGIDYRQLRDLLLIASGRKLTRQESRKWSRFTFRDLVTVRTAIQLAGGADALQKGSHLRLKRVKVACEALRKTFKIDDPMAVVKLDLQGKTVVAQFDGVAFEAVNGQLLLNLHRRVDHEIGLVSRSFTRRLSAERNQIKRKGGASRRRLTADIPVHNIQALRRGAT